jgi:hypothetical protein
VADIPRGSVVVQALCYEPEDTMRWSFPIYLILTVALGPGVYSASNRYEYQKQKRMFLGSRARPVRRADNLTAIWEPTVYTMWDP